MPWSPIPKFPAIINDLKRQGRTKQTELEPLKKAIMRQTGIVGSDTIKRTIEAMETLDFLAPSKNGATWDINKDAEL